MTYDFPHTCRDDHEQIGFSSEQSSRNEFPPMKGSALFSSCGRWRWWLLRQWDESLPMAAIIGMNPSTADAFTDDPTVVREIEHLRRWGYGGLLKLNVYAYKATLQRDLWAARKRGVDIIGQENTADHIVHRLQEWDARKVLAAWGRLKTDRGVLLAASLKMRDVKLDCFRRNTDGSPAHPLYLPYDLTPQPWNH